jgi:hypothetical protein
MAYHKSYHNGAMISGLIRYNLIMDLISVCYKQFKLLELLHLQNM